MSKSKAWHDYYDVLIDTLAAQTEANSSLAGILGHIGQNLSTIEQGVVDTSYGDATNVPSGVPTILASYVAGGPTRVKTIEVSGTNIASYTVTVNDAIVNKKQTFYGYLDNEFNFSKGFPLLAGDVVKVQVLHQQPSLGEFNAFILVLKD